MDLTDKQANQSKTLDRFGFLLSLVLALGLIAAPATVTADFVTGAGNTILCSQHILPCVQSRYSLSIYPGSKMLIQ